MNFSASQFQGGAERRGIFQQQPVTIGHERDAAGIGRSPSDDAREDFSGGGFAQQIGERSLGFTRGEFGGGGEKMFRRALDLFREPAPVEIINGFGRNDLVQ